MRITSRSVGSLVTATLVMLAAWTVLLEFWLDPLQLAAVTVLVVALLALLTHGLPPARLVGVFLLAAVVIAPIWLGLHGPGFRRSPQVVSGLIVLVGLAGVVATRRPGPGEYEPFALLGSVLPFAALAASLVRIADFGPDTRGYWLDVDRISAEARAPRAWQELRVALGLFVASFAASAVALVRVVSSGWQRRGIYLCLHGLAIGPAWAYLVLSVIGGPHVGPTDHLPRPPFWVAGPAFVFFALVSGALAYLVCALVVRTLGARRLAVARAAWPTVIAGWAVLVGLQVPKVVGVEPERDSWVPDLTVAQTGVSEFELDGMALCVLILDADRFTMGYDFLLGEREGWSRDEVRRDFLETRREDPRWWDEVILPNALGLAAAPEAPFEWVADELRWMRAELGVERARLGVRMPESYGGWRVWLAGYPTRWSRVAYLPVLLDAPADADVVWFAPDPGQTYAQVVAEIDVLRAAGRERIVLELD